MTRTLLAFSLMFLVATSAHAEVKSISELKALNPSSGEYTIEGFSILSSDCSCPEGAECDPCPPDYIIVCEQDTKSFPPSAPYLTVFTKNPKAFYAGEKYRFTVSFTDSKLFSTEPFNDATLVSSESVYHVNV